ncbi:MAG: hypothetical protein H7177_05670 [Rhizobacter sp.]|nr:hypothetical protein [Bacteriovorax sp.]
MNKYFLLLLFFSTTSFSVRDESYSLLSSDDFQMAELENESPAIRIPIKTNQWINSYNKWFCFSRNEVSIETIEVDYNGPKQIPALSISLDNHKNLMFELDHDESWNTPDIINSWESSLDASKNVCIYAAFMQDFENESTFYIEKIKFENQYWSRSQTIEELANDDLMED